MTHGVIGAIGVSGILHCLVNYEMNALERYIHGELGAVRTIEGRESFRSVHFYGTLRYRPEGAVVHL